MTVRIVLAFMAAAAQTVGAQSRQVSGSVAAVTQFYKDFAWEAVASTPDPEWRSHVGLVDQPRNVLRRYFDKRLTDLWLADRACARATRGECRLSFAPMWDSQDPMVTGLHVIPTSDSSIVKVEFYTLGTKEPVVLTYTLSHTPQGWRIRDIAQGARWSLIALLSGKP